MGAKEGRGKREEGRGKREEGRWKREAKKIGKDAAQTPSVVTPPGLRG
jgi:hypothetical protein